MVRTEFSPEALFSSANPLPDRVDLSGTWAEWDVGDLAEGSQNTIDDLEERMTAMEARVLQREEQLQAQFQAMEIALSQLQSQSAFLSQQSMIYSRR